MRMNGKTLWMKMRKTYNKARQFCQQTGWTRKLAPAGRRYKSGERMSKIDIKQKFSLFNEEWTPKIIAESNGQQVKIAKGSGELFGICTRTKTSCSLSLKAN